jgi:SAM-dependent methyltransferase
MDLPPADLVLVSNVLHDWGDSDCRRLLCNAARAVRPGGALVVHDTFLDGPDPVNAALHSVTLFLMTQGRAYTQHEVVSWVRESELEFSHSVPTWGGMSALVARKPGPTTLGHDDQPSSRTA